MLTRPLFVMKMFDFGTKPSKYNYWLSEFYDQKRKLILALFYKRRYFCDDWQHLKTPQIKKKTA